MVDSDLAQRHVVLLDTPPDKSDVGSTFFKFFRGDTQMSEEMNMSMERSDDAAVTFVQDVKIVEDESASGQKKNLQSREVAVYKSVVTESESMTWEALKRMGRPMGLNHFVKETTSAKTADLINLAATKLLLRNAPQDKAYNESTMFGVAAMPCRIGVRPRVTSILSSRAVADFVAVLAYVNYEHDGYVSSYASDPVLALGAMEVWYAVDIALARYILPQLKKLMLDESLVTGEASDVVARILLLLVMDKCAMGNASYSEHRIIGQFVSVEKFLNVLEGDEDMPIFTKDMEAASDTDKAAYVEWRKHGLKLEPNEDTLWFLLWRRAAGISPTTGMEFDLVIPVFKKPQKSERGAQSHSTEENMTLSVILVKVSRPSDSSAFPECATTRMDPWLVFGPKTTTKMPTEKKCVNPLSEVAVNEVIRIYVDVNHSYNAYSHHRFVYSAALSTTKFTLCFRSVCREVFSFLDEEVAQRLVAIVESQWNPMTIVDGDLQRRRELEKQSCDGNYRHSRAASNETLRGIAAHGLVDAPGDVGGSENENYYGFKRGSESASSLSPSNED